MTSSWFFLSTYDVLSWTVTPTADDVGKQSLLFRSYGYVDIVSSFPVERSTLLTLLAIQLTASFKIQTNFQSTPNIISVLKIILSFESVKHVYFVIVHIWRWGSKYTELRLVSWHTMHNFLNLRVINPYPANVENMVNS